MTKRNEDIIMKYLDSFKLKKNTFGVYLDKNDSFNIGNSKFEIQDDLIVVGQLTFKISEGLLELLFRSKPNSELYDDEDLQNYKKILVATNAHKKNFTSSGEILGKKSEKYANIIAPMFKHSGKGIVLMNSDKIKFKWQNVNELITRLKKIYYAKAAGNNSLQPEIDYILKQLRNNKIII